MIWYNLMPSLHTGINVANTNPSRILSSLLPSGSIIWLVSIMGTFENNGVGQGFGNLNSSTRVYGHFTSFYVWLTILGSYLLYAFLIWYLDNVWPFQHGVPKSPIFLFKPSYWLANGNDGGGRHVSQNGHSNNQVRQLQSISG